MNTFDRRHLLTTAVGAGAAVAAGQWFEPVAAAADHPKQRIKIGQIGTGHEHASAKMATFRKLSDHYEVVGIACHLIDLVVTLLGKPDRIVAFPRQTCSDVEMCDNGLIVFEYPKTTVTIRTASLEVEGYQRRQLVVCGDQGTIDIQPLETIYIQPPRPQKLQLTLSRDRDSYKKGCREVSFPRPPGRYDDQLIELARVIRGDIENPYPLQHELLVQQCLLEACGYPTDTDEVK